MDDGNQLTDLIDFIIPAGETYNLSKSYVALNMRINAPSDGTIYDFVLTSKKPSPNFNRASPSLVHMVKNINVFAERTGKIEDIRAVNLLRGVLNNYTDGREKEEMLSRPFAVRDSSLTYCNPFVLKKKHGSDPSEYKEVEMQIPLKDLLNIGNVEAYSTAKYGQTHIHLELDNNIEFVQSQGDSNDVTLDTGGTPGSADITALSGVLGNTTYWNADQTGGVPDTNKFNAGTFTSVSSDSISKWTSDRIYYDMKLSPFWVSQQIGIPTVAARNTGDFKLTIDSIAQTAAGKVELSFAVPHSDLITQTVTKNGDVTNEISLAVSAFAAGSIAAGDKVSGTGIPDDTTVKSVKTLVNSAVLSAQTASGNTVLTFAGAVGSVAVGNKVFGLNMPDGTTITGITGPAYTMSNNATATIPIGTRIAFTNNTDSTDNIIISKAATVTNTTPIKVSHTISQGDAATVKGVDAAATLSIDPPELVLYKNPGAKVPDQINYTTYFTEEDTTNKGSSLQKLYQLNQAGINCIIASPKDNDRLNSSFQSLDKYRIRVDNKDLQDRDYENLSALSYDFDHRALLNMGEQAQNLTTIRPYVHQAQSQATQQSLDDLVMVNDGIMFPLPPSNRPKMVEVNVDKATGYSAANDVGIIVHTEVERSI